MTGTHFRELNDEGRKWMKLAQSFSHFSFEHRVGTNTLNNCCEYCVNKMPIFFRQTYNLRGRSSSEGHVGYCICFAREAAGDLKVEVTE